MSCNVLCSVLRAICAMRINHFPYPHTHHLDKVFGPQPPLDAQPVLCVTHQLPPGVKLRVCWTVCWGGWHLVEVCLRQAGQDREQQGGGTSLERINNPPSNHTASFPANLSVSWTRVCVYTHLLAVLFCRVLVHDHGKAHGVQRIM